MNKKVRKLQILIKQKEQEIRDKKKLIAKEEEELDRYTYKIKTLDETYEKERALVQKHGVPESWTYYVQGYKMARNGFMEIHRKLSAVVSKYDQQILEIYQDMKAFDLYEKQIQHDIKKDMEKKEQSGLDDLSSRKNKQS